MDVLPSAVNLKLSEIVVGEIVCKLLYLVKN